MTPEQLQQFFKANEEATGRAIQTHVNGKIEKISHKLDDHMEKFNEHAQVDKDFQADINDNIKWVVRLIIGAVLLGILGLIFK